MGFGLYRVLKIIQPTGPVTAVCKKKLDYMLNAPITMVWVDEKAPPNKSGVILRIFFPISPRTKRRIFQTVICERMFFDWKTEKFYRALLDMYDDVRNLKPRFIAAKQRYRRKPSPFP